MRIGYTPEQEELRRELRAYFSKLMTPERVEALSSPTTARWDAATSIARPSHRWARTAGSTLSWPEEYGGQARPPMDGLIFTDEAAIASAPVPFLTINSVAPTIMALRHRGTEEVLPAQDRRGRACTSPSATRSRARAPTWRRCAPPRCATATTT